MKAFQRPNELPRSRLSSLVPCEAGTLWTECFTSYLNRLGWPHHVSPRPMVVQEIGPYLAKSQEISGTKSPRLGALSRGTAMNMTGSGSFASECARLLAK